jgi:hypothetical protein
VVICVECKYYCAYYKLVSGKSCRVHICSHPAVQIPPEPAIDYITGEICKSKKPDCILINKYGDCKLFEKKLSLIERIKIWWNNQANYW